MMPYGQRNRQSWRNQQQAPAQAPGQPHARRLQQQQLVPPRQQLVPPRHNLPAHQRHPQQPQPPIPQVEVAEEMQQHDDTGEEAIPVLHLAKGDVVKCPVPICGRQLAKDFTQASFTFVLDKDLQDVMETTKGERRKFIERFLRMVNSLLNQGGGNIYIHTQPHLLNFWDQQVDDDLMKLVPDGTFFNENFERHVIEGHVIFRVKPRHRPHLITLDFNSKVSLNKGLSDPTHAQMKHLLTRPYPDQVGCPQMMFDPATLKRGDRVTFHENINMQAKVVIDEALNKKTPKKVKDRASKLLLYWWDFLELPNFIAAFAKQWNGGSFFLGLKEEKTEHGPRWKPVPNTQGLWGVLETDIQCWADDKNTEDKKISHLAKAEDVPQFEVRSGHFTCVGVSLTENEKQKLEEQLRGKIRNFLPRRPSGNAAGARRDQELVELKFHPVSEADGADRSQEAGGSGQGGQAASDSTLYVVEARVNYYHGVCFNNKRGPVAYKFDHKDRPSHAVKLPLDIWLQAQA